MLVAVLVGVGVAVWVGVRVVVLVGVRVAVWVEVLVEVTVGVLLAVCVGSAVAVCVGTVVAVDVRVGVAVLGMAVGITVPSLDEGYNPTTAMQYTGAVMLNDVFVGGFADTDGLTPTMFGR